MSDLSIASSPFKVLTNGQGRVLGYSNQKGFLPGNTFYPTIDDLKAMSRGEGLSFTYDSREDWNKLAERVRAKFPGDVNKANQHLAAIIEDHVRRGFPGMTQSNLVSLKSAKSVVDSVAEYLNGYTLLLLERPCTLEKMQSVSAAQLADIAEIHLSGFFPLTHSRSQYLYDSLQQLDLAGIEKLTKDFALHIKERRQKENNPGIMLDSDALYMRTNIGNVALKGLWEIYNSKNPNTDKAKMDLALLIMSLGRFEAKFIDQELFNQIPYADLVRAESAGQFKRNETFYKLLHNRVTQAGGNNNELPLLKKVALELFELGHTRIDSNLIASTDVNLEKILKEARELLNPTDGKDAISGERALHLIVNNIKVPRFLSLLEVLAAKIDLSKDSEEAISFRQLLDDTASSPGGTTLISFSDRFSPTLLNLLKPVQLV